MEKVYGSPKRQDGLYKVGRNKYELIYGFGKDREDDEIGWNYRHRFDHRPTLDEIREVIVAQINADTDAKILSQFTWDGKRVWLSQENQMNFKAAYDIAVQTGGAALPVKFKLGEDSKGAPVYHTFTDLDTFTDFYTKAVAHVVGCLNDGWQEKDSVDYDRLLII